jgi:hypothetical protein
VAAALMAAGDLAAQTCSRTFVANVVAIEQFIWYNRLGAHEPDQLMYVLEQDLVSSSGGAPSWSNHQLRPGKRPRPLVLRVTAGSCLKVNFRNWLSASAGGLGTRATSVHVTGMQLQSAITDDGSNVGLNPTSLVEPGQSRTYTLFAEHEGTYLMYSTGQMTGGDGDGGQIGKGLFGAVNVQPAGAEFYRSQLSRADMDLAADSITAAGYPAINYNKVYPALHSQGAGRPIVRMTKGDTIVHGDLNAIITGPNRGNFASSAYPNPGVAVYNEVDSRLRPFREFTVIFHDEVGLVQAFDSIYNSQQFEYTLHGGRDAFAINYGTGGIGSEILANRFGFGPMADCNECKFEEFFLSSWVVGDPAMVVDNPAAAVFSPSNPTPGPAATLARYPQDPSNVFHSYLNDHVKIRNLHAGPKEHHVFHLHAHQWLHTPNSDGSNYHDSQAIGPGAGYTYEITYGGSGNRNDTPGDAILHCHFYPHFAQGMWGLWRVHDVFERGTQLDAQGRVASGARALPDGEITAGTPIPGLVPLPTYALAPQPTATRPGYPFFIPGVAGHRPPKPPLDTYFDGGLPRHVVVDGVADFPMPLDTRSFEKHDETLGVQWLPENGTALEQQAMAFHEATGYTTPVADLWSSTGLFHTNGLPRVAGAPFADPCGLRGSPRGTPLTIKSAAFQLDSIFYNKARWTFRQHRMFALWGDVAAFRGGRAPEPLFFRAHDNSCITYHLVNLIPAEYEQDDFQVQTPTDVVGQHIHLVKFDVTSSDGAANGYNYEDGSLSPGDVQARIAAIRQYYNCGNTVSPPNCPGPAQPHPYFGAGPNNAWLGAQETIQRWWVDPVLRGNGTSPLGAVFTHDHFGPSTHQQAGLYAALIPEDVGTTWRDPETGTVFGNRFDGGPTSWRANIRYADTTRSFREFNLQIADFALAYGAEGFRGSIGRIPPINPPGKDEVGLPDLLRPPFARNGGPPGLCPNHIDLPPCPEIISADDPGTMLVNYRNEPIALRVRNPGTNQQAAADSGNLSYAFSSQRARSDTRFNTFGPYGQRPGELRRDAFTPLLRIYEDDRVRVNLLVGAHEEGHNVNVRGTRWLFEPLDRNSGWRNSQMAGISEYHGFRLTPMIGNPRDLLSDFLYESAATDDRWGGMWGLLRMYRTRQRNLCPVNATTCPLGGGIFGGRYDERVEEEMAKGVPEDDARLIADDDTGEPQSLSLIAAQQAETNPSEKAVVDGFADADLSSPIPDPADTTAWEGDNGSLGSVDASKGRLQPGGGWTSADSVKSGYGNQPIGGFDYDQFEYEPGSRTERVTTGTAPPSGFGLTYAGDMAYVVEPDGMPGEYEMAGPKYTGSGPYRGFQGVCPRIAPVRYYEISAIDARTRLPGGKLVYNARPMNGGPLVDTAAILYVFTADLRRGLLTSQPDPLVLRANAGECVLVRLRNELNTPLLDPVAWNTLPPIVDRFNSNQVHPSTRVGLHPQLVGYDAQFSDGSEVGINRNTTVAPGRWRLFTWYAGDVRTVGNRFRATPIEFGGSNLMSSDPIEHASKGAIGALIIEPRRSTHHMDPGSRVRATIVQGKQHFREQVLLWQDDLNLQFGSAVTLPRWDCDPDEPMEEEEREHCEKSGGDGSVSFARGDPVPNLAEAEDPEDSGQKAVDYRTEPLWIRRGFAPNAELGLTRTFPFRGILTDTAVGGRPQTPILEASPGEAVRFRILESGGHARNHVFNLHGHIWEEEPWEGRSILLGSNPLTEWRGARDLHGPGNHHDILLRNGAGGRFSITGEYLWRDQASFQFDGGIWGLLRVRTLKTITPLPWETAEPDCAIDERTGETACAN